MQEIGYCYLSDAIGVEEFEPETYENVGSRTLLIYKEYKDPDECSEKLYEDLLEIWNKMPNIKFERAKDKNGKTICQLTDNIMRYSSDFIGPSRAWARCLIPDEEIGKYLKEARTIGGHMLWPRHKIPTINTARGGAGGFFDRFDFTLAEIKNYYDGKDEFVKESFRKVLENKEEKVFLDKFKKNGFKEFIDYWQLTPFIKEEQGEYKVISLVKSDLKNGKKELISKNESLFPGDECAKINKYDDLDILINKKKDFQYAERLQESYYKYIENNLWAIKKRDKLIETLIEN